MKHFLTAVMLCLALCPVLVSAQTTISNDDAAKLISRVKQTPASQLDSALPQMTFEKWVVSQVGKDAAINWAVRNADGQRVPWVEADVLLQGRPGIVIMIAGTPEPTFRSLELVRAGDAAEWSRLRELPEAVRRAKDGSGEAQSGEAQIGHTTPTSDYIISDGPVGPLDGQIRYLMGHWPRDFEISVVEALTDSTCDQRSYHCSLRVKPVGVILGHQHETSYIVWYGPAKHCKDDLDRCVYVYDHVQFEAKRGDRMVALLSAAIRQPHQAQEYIASRLDRADDAIVESARNSVAETIMAGAHCQLP
jgi:hypothetical protein